MFTGTIVVKYANSRNINLINSTPYYAQANEQVKVVNKTIIGLFIGK